MESRANQSGATLRTLIAGTVNRTEEMQSNLLAGLVRADKTALTIAQLRGFDGSSEAGIGTYENGGFDREIEPLSETEREEVCSKKIADAQALVALRVPRGRTLKEVGLDVADLMSDTKGGARGTT